MALNLQPVLTNERYVQYMARESALYDPNLAVDENVGAEYLTMMSNLAGKDIDVSKYKPGVARYLSNEDKVNYIWNNYFNEDADLAAEYNKGFADKAYHERNRQIYEAKSGIEKVFSNIGGAFAALGEGIASIPNDLYTTFTGLAWTFTGDSYWQKKTQEGLYDIHGSMEEYYEQYTNFTRSDIGNITYEVFQNIGRMAPMIIAAIATSGVSAAGQAAGWSAKAIAAANTAIQVAGAVTYYATMPGQTYQEILNNPNYKITSDAWASNKGEVGRWQIFTYAMGSVAIEAFTESAFASKIFKFGIVDPDKVAVKMFSDRIAQSIAAFTMDALGEGIEEMVSEILEPMLKTAVIDRGSFSDVMASPNFKDIIHAGLVGALCGAIMGGGARLTGKIATRKARAEMGGLSYTQYSAIQNMLKDTKTSNAVTKLQAELSAKGINLTETQITKLRQGQQLTEADLTSEQKTNVLDANQYINDFQKASETLAKNEETASKAAAIMLKVYQTLGESDFTKAMTMWLSSEQSKLDAIEAFKSVEGKTQWENLDAKKTAVVNDFNTSMKSEGVTFQPTATPLTQNQRVLSNLLKTYGIDTIFGKYIDVDGSGTRTVYNAHAANKSTVLIDEALFSRYSQQYIINQIVNEEIGHTLQMNVEGAVSMNKLVALQKTLQQLNGAHQDADMSAYANLDPKSVEYNAEAQAKSWISPLFYLDQKTIGDIFKVDKGIFTVLSRTLKDMKKKAQPKAGTDLYTRTMYRTLAMASMMYDTAIISGADTVEQAKAMASKTSLTVWNEAWKDIDKLSADEINARIMQNKFSTNLPINKTVAQVTIDKIFNEFGKTQLTDTAKNQIKESNDFRERGRMLLEYDNYKKSFQEYIDSRIDSLPPEYTRERAVADIINSYLLDEYGYTIHPVSGDILKSSRFSEMFKFDAVKKLYDDRLKAQNDYYFENVKGERKITYRNRFVSTLGQILNDNFFEMFEPALRDTIRKFPIRYNMNLKEGTGGVWYPIYHYIDLSVNQTYDSFLNALTHEITHCVSTFNLMPVMNLYSLVSVTEHPILSKVTSVDDLTNQILTSSDPYNNFRTLHIEVQDIVDNMLEFAKMANVLAKKYRDCSRFQLTEQSETILKSVSEIQNDLPDSAVTKEQAGKYRNTILKLLRVNNVLRVVATVNQFLYSNLQYTLYEINCHEGLSRLAGASVTPGGYYTTSIDGKGGLRVVRTTFTEKHRVDYTTTYNVIGTGDLSDINITLVEHDDHMLRFEEGGSKTFLASKETANTQLKRTVQKADVTNETLLAMWDTANKQLIKQIVNEAENGDIGKKATNEAIYKIINPDTQITSPLDIEFVKELIPFVEACKNEFGTDNTTLNVQTWKETQAKYQKLYENRATTELTSIEKRQANAYERSLGDSKFAIKVNDPSNGALNVAIINTIETGSMTEYSKLYRAIVGKGVGAVTSLANDVALTEGIENTAGFNQTEYEETKLDVPQSTIDAARALPQEQRARMFKKFLSDKNYLEEFLSKYGVDGFKKFIREGLGISEKAFNKYFSQWESSIDEAQTAAEAKETAKNIESSVYNQAARGVKLTAQRINDLFAGKLDEQGAKTLYSTIRTGRQTVLDAVAQSGHTKAEIYAEIHKYYKPVRSKKTTALKTVVEETTKTKVEAPTETTTKTDIAPSDVAVVPAETTTVTPTETVETPSKEEVKLEEEVKVAEVAKEIATGTESVAVRDSVENHPEAVVEAVNEVMPEPTAENIERVNETIYENVVENPVNDLVSNLSAVLDENSYSKEVADMVQFDKDSDKAHKVASMEVLNDVNPVFKSQLDGACKDADTLNPLVDELIKASNSGKGFKARMADVVLAYIIGSPAFVDSVRMKAIDAMSGKVSEAGHTLYVSSTAIHKARAEMAPVTTMLEEAQKESAKVETLEELVEPADYAVDIFGMSLYTQGQIDDMKDPFKALADEAEATSKLSEEERKKKRQSTRERLGKKLDEVRKANNKRINDIKKMILDENATAVEIETLGNELELRTQLHDELLKKKPDYNRIADLEYRLCDWWGKAKLEQILIATIFQKTLAETTRYKIKDLKDPTIRAEVLTQFASRARTYKYFSMLSSPATWFRNIATNSLAKLNDSMAIMVSTLFDKISPNTPAGEYKYGVYAKESTAVKEYFDDAFVKNGRVAYIFRQNAIDQNKYATALDGSGKPYTNVEIKRRVNVELTFGNGKLGKVLKKWNSAIDFFLNAGDTMFVQRDFCKYLKNMFELNISKIYAEIKADPTLKDSIPDMTAEELNSDNGKRAVLDNIPEDTLAIFIDKALAISAKTYFKNSNKVTEFFQYVGRKYPGFNFLASIMVTPFARVSTNIITTILDYSPLGFLNFAKMKAQDKGWIKAELSNIEKAFRKSDEIRVLGKAATGTAMMLIGMVLGALGWITLDDDDNWGSVIKIGDFKLRLSDLSPALTPLTMGAAAISSSKQGKGFFNGLYKDFSDATLFQTFDNAFEYNSSVADYFKNLAANYTTQYIPSVIKNVAKWADNRKLQKDSNWFVNYFQTIAENIPGLSYAVPAKVNAYTGDFERRYGVPVIGALVNTVSPIKISIKPKSEVEKAFKEAGIKAGSATGTITIDGEKYKIKAWQLQDLRTVKARWLAAKTKELISSGEYKSLSKKAKQKKLRSLNSKATNYAKNWYKEKYL